MRKSNLDGLSNTVIINEIRAGIDPFDPRGVWALGQIGSSATARHGQYDDAGKPNHEISSGEAFIGCDALTGKLGADTLQRLGMPCYPSYLQLELNAQAGSRSQHRGGVNAGFCDGSVQLLVDDIDAKVWHALHTRAGRD